MIYLGYRDVQKREVISQYQAEHSIQKTVVISADDFPLLILDTDQIKYSDVIMYVTFYRLLQEIDQNTLIVLNEVLRTQNRYDLSCNCIRNYLNQTQHQLIFQQLPQIDTQEDFMILFDFDTQSRWKRRKFDPYLIETEARVFVQKLPLVFRKVGVPISQKTRGKYEKARANYFSNLGKRDPHIIPRNLYLLGGKDKQAFVDMPLFSKNGHNKTVYVARNQRVKQENIISYREVDGTQTYAVFEFPHRFIDFSDFVKQTWQSAFDVLVADLKVDEWYYQRYVDWSERINETYASLPTG